MYKIYCFLLLSLSSFCYGAELELGIGSLATSLPKYIGSDQQSNYLLPMPYFYYKSKKFELDRNALTGFLWQKDKFHLELSASGSIPVNSEETQSRQGMPDLDFVGELGPEINYYLLGSPNEELQLALGVNIKKAFAIDFDNIHAFGENYGTSLDYQHSLSSWFGGQLNINVKINVIYAENDYLNYFYAVPAQYQTNQRTTYFADSGYTNSSLSVGFTWQHENLWIGAYSKFTSLATSVIEKSPLVKSNHNWSAGIGIVWIFYQKKDY